MVRFTSNPSILNTLILIFLITIIATFSWYKIYYINAYISLSYPYTISTWTNKNDKKYNVSSSDYNTLANLDSDGDGIVLFRTLYQQDLFILDQKREGVFYSNLEKISHFSNKDYLLTDGLTLKAANFIINFPEEEKKKLRALSLSNRINKINSLYNEAHHLE